MASLKDIYVEFVVEPWPEPGQDGRYVEAIVHLQTYLRQLVVTGSVPVAARAAAVLLRHGHDALAETTRTAIAERFPASEES